MNTLMQKGFTLIETLIAIAILTIAIAGPLMTAERSIVAAYTARDQLTASYLGQEAIEYVRTLRDNAYLADQTPNAWNDFLTGTIAPCIGSSATCLYDPAPQQTGVFITRCSGSACTPLYLSNGIYTQTDYAGAAVTPFTRTITLTQISPTEELVAVTVAWQTNRIPYTLSLTDHLTPWQ